MANDVLIVTNGPWGGIATVFGVTLVRLSGTENGRTGTETTFVYQGQYYPIKAQQNQVRQWGAYNLAIERLSGGTDWQLTAVFPFDEQGREPANLAGIYELDVETAQPSIYSSQKLRSLLPDNWIALVARVVSNFEAGEYSMTTSGGNTDGGWFAAISDIQKGITAGPDNYQARAIQLFATVAAKKTDSFIEYYNVFRRTLTAALPGQIEADYTGVGQIWTSQEIADFENVNPNGIIRLNPDSQWIKSRPQVIAAAGQRTQINYTYTEFRQANGLLYDAFGAAQLLYADPADLPPLGS